MIRRVLSLSIVSLIALCPLAALAQETAPVTRAEFKLAIEELKQQIQSLKSPVPAPPEAASVSHDADSARRIADLEKQVAELQLSNKKLVDISTDHEKMLRDIASDRTSPGGGTHFVPNVQAIRDDQDSRRQLVDTVVHDMARATGELKIHNDMSVGQSLVVNGVATVFVPAHGVQAVNVPSGTATTELAGEGVKSWMVGAPGYSQDIIIAPARNTVVSSLAWQYDPVTGVWWRTLQ